MGTCCAPFPLCWPQTLATNALKPFERLRGTLCPALAKRWVRPIHAEGGYMLTHWPQRPQGFVMVLAVTCVAMTHLSNCQRIAP